jgi:hypothetical protein
LNDFLCPSLNFRSIGFGITVKIIEIYVRVMMSGVGMRIRNMMHLGRRIWRAEGHRGGIGRTTEPSRENITRGALDRRRQLRYRRRVMKGVYDAHMVRSMPDKGVTVNGRGRGLDEVVIIYVVWIIFDVIRGTGVIIRRSFLGSHFISSEETTTRTTRATHSMFMARLMKIGL